MSNVPLLFVTVYPGEVGPPRSVSVQLMPALALAAPSANTASERVVHAARHQAGRGLRIPMPELFSGQGVTRDDFMGFMMLLIQWVN